MKTLPFLFLFAFSCSTLEKQVHRSIKEKIHSQWPGANVGPLRACQIGKDLEASYGVVIVRQTALLTDADIIPLVVEPNGGSWTMHQLPKFFTNEFSENNTYSDIDVRCIQPSEDVEVSDKIGKYVGEPSKKKTHHICFESSLAYNNWDCFNYDGSGNLKKSFTQAEVEEN